MYWSLVLNQPLFSGGPFKRGRREYVRISIPVWTQPRPVIPVGRRSTRFRVFSTSYGQTHRRWPQTWSGDRTSTICLWKGTYCLLNCIYNIILFCELECSHTTVAKVNIHIQSTQYLKKRIFWINIVETHLQFCWKYL